MSDETVTPLQYGMLHTTQHESIHYYYAMSTSALAKAWIVIVHGLGEHAQRYVPIINFFNKQGYHVLTFDHIGHGESTGARGHIDHWKSYRLCLKKILDEPLKQLNPSKLPIVLYAHSMGALVGLDFLIHFPKHINACILSAPPLVTPFSQNRLLTFTAYCIQKLLPRLTVSSNINPLDISRNPQVVQHYQTDPLNHKRASFNWMVEFLRCVRFVQTHANQFITPVLLIHGEQDRIAFVSGSKLIFPLLASSNKQFKIYENTLHEPHNDINRDAILNDVGEWLNRVLKASFI